MGQSGAEDQSILCSVQVPRHFLGGTQTMKKSANKFAIMGPSFTVVAMVMLIMGKPLDSPWVWFAFALILVCLGVINISYFSLYRDANAIGQATVDGPQGQQ